MVRLTDQEDAAVRAAAGDRRPADWIREQAVKAAKRTRRRVASSGDGDR